MEYFLFKHIDLVHSTACGCAMLNPGWRHMTRRMDNETVLILGIKNTALIEVEGKILEVKPGRVILLPAGYIHKGTEPITEAVSYYWLHFSQCVKLEEELRYYLPKKITEKEALSYYSSPSYACESLQDSIILPQEMDLSNAELFTNLFNKILQVNNKQTYSSLVYRNLVQKLLLDLYGECFRTEHIEQKGTAAQALVHKALLMIEDELSNANASVKYFADRLSVNADYLGRIFKDAMNVSLWQYLSKRRVELSCSRLRETSDSIEKICADCGFGSRRQFYDEFKKYTGKTPAVYRSDTAYIGVNSL